jgi:hypothetical protein
MSSENRTDEAEAPQEDDDDVKMTEKPEVTDEHRAKAKEMRKEYEEERPTITMPGTDGAVSGTAVNEWIDDDGNPKFAKDNPDDKQEDG